MTRCVRALVAILMIGVLAAPAVAQDFLGKRVTLDLKAMAPADAFKILADAVGMGVTVDQAVTAPVDILVRNVTAKTALTTICESIGCRWTASGGTIAVKPAAEIALMVRESRSERAASNEPVRIEKRAQSIERVRAALSRKLPADMKFENTPLATVNERLSAALGLTLTLTSQKPGILTLTADLGNQTLQSALRLLAEQAGSDRTWRIVIKDTTDGKESFGILVFSGRAAERKK